MKKPLVILVAGSPHGGTTITSVALGQNPNIFAAGELKDFPSNRQFAEHNLCSCGQKAVNCSFWAEVRKRYLPWQDHPDEMRWPKLYSIISEVSNRRFVVDVAHEVARVEQLLKIPDIDLYLVHVVRDGMAVLYSRLRKDRRDGIQRVIWKQIPRVVKVSRRWKAQLTRLSQIRDRMDTMGKSINYKDLCLSPASILTGIGEFLDLDFTTVGEALEQERVLHKTSHLIRGHWGVRFHENVKLKYDDRYLKQLSALDTIVFRLATTPAFGLPRFTTGQPRHSGFRNAHATIVDRVLRQSAKESNEKV